VTELLEKEGSSRITSPEHEKINAEPKESPTAKYLVRPSGSSNGRGVAAEGIEEESLDAAAKRNRSLNDGRFLATEIAGFGLACWEETDGSGLGLGLGFMLAMDCSRVEIRVSSRLIRASWRSIREGWIRVSISGFRVSDDTTSELRVCDWVS
jgi:hypothetical protein